MKYVKTNVDGLVKDRESGVFINKNYSEYERLLERRRHAKEIGELKDELSNVQKTLDRMNELEKKLEDLLNDK